MKGIHISQLGEAGLGDFSPGESRRNMELWRSSNPEVGLLGQLEVPEGCQVERE